jgi:hypothetical protein
MHFPSLLILLISSAILTFPATGAELLPAWQDSIQEAERLIQAGEYEQANRIAEKAANKILFGFANAEDAAYTLGVIAILRALAAVGQGDPEHGIWLWHTALSLDPSLEDFGLEPYGELGQLLARSPLKSHDDLDIPEPRQFARARYKSARIKPDIKLKALRHQGNVGYIVKVVVTEAGIPSRPAAFTRCSPKPCSIRSGLYLILDGIWNGEIEPARLDGKPILGFYNFMLFVSQKGRS